MDSDARNWEKLQELFHRLLPMKTEERTESLARCGCEPALKMRVLELLRAFERAQEAPSGAPSTPSEFGPYRILRCLGSGGMGSVYLVERESGGVRRQAALKVLAAPFADSSVPARFQREQRILASLDHPFIARMLEAGVTSDGRPYLAMEYVEGSHLDAWCDRRKLGIEDRLRVFLKICETVEYAHRSLVVHLDLKPSNILVTADGTPKLLDFGTSKLLDTDGRLTTTVAATPSYASPEQLRNEAVTTACDVYSLGAILFELLSGSRPCGNTSLPILIERAMEEREPASLTTAITEQAAAQRGVSGSRLRALLAGDLALIAGKCLRARPQDRYPSVHQLSSDIRRYLEGRPVLARPQTVRYRLRKFARRNRGKLAAAAATALIVAASLGYAWQGQREALREGRRAVQMQTFLYRLFKIANSNYTGKRATTVREFLELGVKVLPEYVKDPADLRRAQLGLAESMYWNGDYSQARSTWNRVVESAHVAHDAASEAEALAFLGYVEMLENRQDLALAHSSRALELSRGSGIPPRTRAECAMMYALVGDLLGRHSEENLPLAEFAVQVSRENRLPPHELGQALYYLGGLLSKNGRLEEAAERLEEALRVDRQDPVALCDQGLVLEYMAGVRWQQGRNEETIALTRQVHDIFTRCRGPEDPETLSSVCLWAGALARSGHPREAIALLEADLPAWRKTFPPGHVLLTEVLQYLALAYVEAGRFREAEALAREALQIAESKVPPGDRRLGRLHLLLGRALSGQARPGEALPHLEAAQRILRLLPDTPAQRAEMARLAALLESDSKP